MRRLILSVVILSSCATRHPVQPTPATWTLPVEYAQCRIAETVTLPDVGTVVIAECPAGTIALDARTKRRVKD